MTLLFSSDNYSNSRDNLSRTVMQFADRRQIQKNISRADNLSLRSTVAPSLTAFIKTTYNKAAGQLLFQLLVAQPLTAVQKIGRQILHSGLLAHGAQAEFCLYSFCVRQEQAPAMKNLQEKYSLKFVQQLQNNTFMLNTLFLQFFLLTIKFLNTN
ncbi:MAG: hypothetical protein HY063_06325 [Bacteroidetes bacterium]|nr:hypothetical protein [Bacteroidota bacterium]